MPVVTIDQGNSSAKVSVFRGSECLCSRRFDVLTPEALAPVIDEFSPRGAIFSSVAGQDADSLEYLRSRLPRLIVMDHDTPVPLRIDYLSPRTLGLDRVATAVAADALAPGERLIVADAGTALTIDVVDGGCFRGGNISAGIRMRLRALADMTHALPLVAPDGPVPAFGRDTETALRCGAIAGAAAEIILLARTAFRPAECSRIFVTGGNAHLLIPLLNGDANCRVAQVDDLLPLGLYRIYLHNENI